MGNLKVFENEEFGKVRVVEVNNEPYFVGKDVAEILGYSNASKALLDHVDAEDKLNNESLSSLGQRGGWIINESGLYSLILSSKLPKAKQFKHWVTAEILPSIRKNGGYINNQENMTPEQVLANAVLVAQRVIAEKDKLIENQATQLYEQKPKVVFADAVSASNNTILIGDLAKIIKQSGYDIGRDRLFHWLRENGYLCKGKGSAYNSPTQYAMDLGLFKVKETVITHADGHISINKTTKVTGKGQLYFVKKFISKAE